MFVLICIAWFPSCRSSVYLRAKWWLDTRSTTTLRRWTCSIQVTWSGTPVRRVSSAGWPVFPVNAASPSRSWPISFWTGGSRYGLKSVRRTLEIWDFNCTRHLKCFLFCFFVDNCPFKWAYRTYLQVIVWWFIHLLTSNGPKRIYTVDQGAEKQKFL